MFWLIMNIKLGQLNQFYIPHKNIHKCIAGSVLLKSFRFFCSGFKSDHENSAFWLQIGRH